MLIAMGELQKLENSSTRRKQEGGGHRVWQPRGCREVRLVLSDEGSFTVKFSKMKASVLAGGDSGSDDEDVKE